MYKYLDIGVDDYQIWVVIMEILLNTVHTTKRSQYFVFYTQLTINKAINSPFVLVSNLCAI